jgi:hypothetical protein
MQRADAMTLYSLDLDSRPNAQSMGKVTHDLDVASGIDKRGEHHIAGDPTDTIQVRGATHGWAPAAARAMRAAMVPAPKPSSIPTTARPGEQDESMALSAVRPASAEP